MITPEGIKMDFVNERKVDGGYTYDLLITPPENMSITEALVIVENYTNQYVKSKGATESIRLLLPKEA